MKSLHFTFPEPPVGMTPFNMVGYGILSWVPPYLFRTPAGTNLWVRGPANMPKDGITPLEGIVETDWLPYTFTINWKITRPGLKISFVKGEPICFLTPTQRHDAERLQPVLQNLASNEELNSEYHEWHERRLRAKAISGEDGMHGKLAVADQGHYIRGEGPGGVRVAEHQTKLHLKPIRDLEPPVIAANREFDSAPHSSESNFPETATLQGFNGSAQLTDQDVIITRRTGWGGRLLGRKEQRLQLPLKKIKSIQVQEKATFTQMAFIRFVVGDAPPELPYVAACRDPYTLLVDKPQLEALRRFQDQLKQCLGERHVIGVKT
jgi:hypothetical protein